MNKNRFQLVICTLLLVVAALIFMLPTSFAQDTTPDAPPAATQEPTGEPVDTTTTTTTTTTSTPVEDIGLTLNWALAFLLLWQGAGIAYSITVEKTIKPVLYGIIGQFTDSTQIRSGVLIIAVFIGAFYAVNEGKINLFADVPFGLFAGAGPAFLLVLNSMFVAAGAFIGHELWQTLESWLKKAKAVFDVLRPTPGRVSSGSS